MPKINPSALLIWYLFILYMLAIFLNGSLSFAYHELVRSSALYIGLVGGYWLLQQLRDQPLKWNNVLITFFILILLADHRASAVQMLGLGAATAAFKGLVRFKNMPVFNPAAIGLVVMSVFGVVTTWWGVSFSPRFTQFDISLAMALTAPVGLYITWKFKEMPTVYSVIGGLVAVSWLINGTVPLRLLLEGTLAFFLLIMATEPKTTPVKDSEEWLFGLVLGASLPVAFKFGWLFPYLLSLLAINLGFVGWKWARS